jgi:hypothetical protein
MRAEMGREVARLGKCFTALLALVRLDAGMGPHVDFQRTRPTELPRTILTRERLFTSVRTRMIGQVPQGTEALLTMLAVIRLYLRMRP